jgi:hypothetical protein
VVQTPQSTNGFWIYIPEQDIKKLDTKNHLKHPKALGDAKDDCS